MQCEICGCQLANSNIGMVNHMKRYHNVASKIKTVQPMPPEYRMSKEEKETAIHKFESKHQGLFICDLPEPKFTPMPFGKVKVEFSDEKCGIKNEDKEKSIESSNEFCKRLDALLVKSEEILKQMKEQYGE